MIWKMFNLQLLKALDSTCSRLLQRVQYLLKAPAHFFNSLLEGNPYLDPFEIIERIPESEIIFMFPVMIWHVG